MKRIFLLAFCSAVAWSCGDGSDSSETSALFKRLSSEQTGIDFVNKVENQADFNIFSYRNFYNGGGVGIGDINADGLVDIYFTRNQGANKLYLNKGNFQFEDITEAAGVGGNKLWSTGVSLVDINSDGLLDIYVSNAGYSKGSDQENELFINNGDLTFTERASAYGLADNGYTTHAAFFDYDKDGDLDAYILNNSFIPVNSLNYSDKRDVYAEDWDVMDFVKGGGDKLMRNDNGQFVDVSEEAGIYGSLIGFGLGVTVGDVNDDNWPDIYISNDFFERDYLYINQADGTFSEEIEQWMGHISLASMGADMADLNNDGHPEIFVTEMLPETDQLVKQKSQFDSYNIFQLKLKKGFHYQFMHNTLQMNSGDGFFKETAWYSGVAASDWSWGALLFDADNDGYRDIFVCNGVYQDVTDQDFIDFFANDVIQQMVLSGVKEEMSNILEKMPVNPQPNKLFRNDGGMKFSSSEVEYGLAESSFSNGAAYADLDNDGDLDLVVSNLNQESFVYENKAAQKGNHSITVELAGPSQNTQAIGAKVYVHVGDVLQYAQLIPSRGFQSSVDPRLNFGLGSYTSVDSLVVVWPDDTRSVLVAPGVDQVVKVDYNTVERRVHTKTTDRVGTLFDQSLSQLEPHTENDFSDFYNEGLIIKKLSREGPAMAVGDLNGDGLEDIVMGGALNEKTKVYVQSPSGRLRLQTTLEGSDQFEDTAAKLFDIDGDGDLDLFVGSGGNHKSLDDPGMYDRIYRNDQGRFEWIQDALPASGYNTATCQAFDYDNDGDLDLFVGSRSIPVNYGSSPRSFLLENDGGGKFSDVTVRRGRALRELGMVTASALTDVDQDGTDELVVVGEWMAPVLFKINNRRLEKMDTNLDNLSGWWHAVVTDDVDGDGDQDMIIGNRGENFYFSASEEAPAKLWLKDFDSNGTVEKLMTRTVNGKDLPLTLKKELTNEVPSLKKQNLRHDDYSRKTIQELFDKEVLSQATVKEATLFGSVVAINQGNGSFDIRPLPMEAQLSSIRAIQLIDVNSDGLNDLILLGNDSDYTPQYSRSDANHGLLLINLGAGRYKSVSSNVSGIKIKGDVRDVSLLRIGGEDQVIVAINNSTPILLNPN